MRYLFTILAAIFLLGCTSRDIPEVIDPEELFWNNLSKHCGKAFAGGLTKEPPGDEMLTGTELLIAHFRECGDDTLRIPFHIEIEETNDWDRSRTWLFIRHDDRLEIRHDHRKRDGSEDENNWYGGYTEEPGSESYQEFIYHGRVDPEGKRLGWRIEIYPDERYTYGTIRGDDWTWRVDFDLTEAIDAPPAPWGHE
jgi:hypothetical protein